MDKDWIISVDGVNLKFKRETLLNYVMNRWGLNKSFSVGPTSELIRKCAPETFKDWEDFYFKNAKQNKKDGLNITREYITGIGQTIYIKLTEVVQNELISISEEECIDYAYNLVLNRTYEGYITEITTIYGQLEALLNVKIIPAVDKWDRTYSVDFYIAIGDKYLGLQIKPLLSGRSLNEYQWIEMHRKNQERFTNEFGGKVFFVFSHKVGEKKTISNIEVVKDIKAEIERLSQI